MGHLFQCIIMKMMSTLYDVIKRLKEKGENTANMYNHEAIKKSKKSKIRQESKIHHL